VQGKFQTLKMAKTFLQVERKLQVLKAFFGQNFPASSGKLQVLEGFSAETFLQVEESFRSEKGVHVN